MKTFTSADGSVTEVQYETGDTATAIFEPAVGVAYPTYLTPILGRRIYVEFDSYIDEEDSSLYEGQSSWASPGLITGTVPESWLNDIRMQE